MTAKPVIDLTGPQGNAFYLIGFAKQFSKTLHKDEVAIEAEMMASGNYDNLVAVFRREFGEHVVIIDPQDDEFEDEDDEHN